MPKPTAAFYAFFKVKDVKDTEAFCKEILLKTGVGIQGAPQLMP